MIKGNQGWREGGQGRVNDKKIKEKKKKSHEKVNGRYDDGGWIEKKR